MCGIAGLVSELGLGPEWVSELQSLGGSLRHRGPDDYGFYSDADRGERPGQQVAASGSSPPRVAFAHRRLSIIDLTEAARQPMVRANGKVFITYNGEVYNFRELRRELEAEGVVFRTSSDTEVVLEAYLRWGIAATSRLRGIFAFAIADLARGRVYLARDHLGVKPLYFTRRGTTWLFASELKAIVDLPGFAPRADPGALRQYLRYLWIPGEQTGIAGVSKLAPGSWLEIDLERGTTRTEMYWSPLHARLVAPRVETVEASIEHLRDELARVVNEQMVSDVPLGAFLSGGLDSSMVVALMSKRGGPRPRTYSVGYSADDLAYDIVPDDTPWAREVGRMFETEATEIVLSPELGTLLPSIVETLDEPLGDPAALSSYLLCRAAKQTLTVMLSGMGADELFGGYPRQRALVHGGTYRAAPRWVRGAFRSAVDRLPGAGRGLLARIGRGSKKFVAAAERDPLGHYIAMETYFSEEQQQAVLDPSGQLATGPDLGEVQARRMVDQIRAITDEPIKQAILWDLLTYLPNLNLAYTDRTSMAHAVEVRVPFLDVGLVEWSLALRANELIRWRRGRLQGKWLLKQAARALLPPRVIWRKKAGFGAPVRSWLRGGLSELREELLGARGLDARGWFDPGGVARLQSEFLSGRRDHSLQIWMLISLELWARRFLDRPRRPAS